MGPTEIFRRLDDDSPGLASFALSLSFILELVVVAKETGCRGRELRKVGDSFGAGAAMNACNLVLLLLGVTSP